MILSARFLTDVGGVNVFDYAQTVEFTEGDVVDVYFQLIDSALDKASNGYKPSGRRFAPASGATLQAVIDNIDNDRQVTRGCTQPFTQDPSIWKLSILSTDVIKGTSNLKLTLTEGAKATRALVKNAFRAFPNSNI